MVRAVLASIVAAVVLSVLEAVTYGILLPDFIDANRVYYPGLIKDPPETIPGLFFNLVWCSMLAVFFDRWAGIRSFAAGAAAGAVILTLVVLGINLGYLAFSNLLRNPAIVIPVKLVAMAISGAIVGGLIAVMLVTKTTRSADLGSSGLE